MLATTLLSISEAEPMFAVIVIAVIIVLWGILKIVKKDKH